MARRVAVLAALTAFLIPYSIGWDWAWWKFIPSTIAIILLMRWAYPRSWSLDLGLRIRGVDLVLALVFYFCVWLLGSHLIGDLLSAKGFSPGPDSTHFGWKYLSVFQALNEEMLVRAFLLTTLAIFIQSRTLISIAAAAVFALLHFALYQFGKLNTALDLQVLATLFLFALAGNAIFFATKNIAATYAIHVGWNVNRFGQDWVEKSSGVRLQEALGFNIVEGSLPVLILAASLVVIAVVWNRLPFMPALMRWKKCQ